MFKPMLACKQPPRMSQDDYLNHISKFLPLYVQPKEDGARALINEKQFPRSRTDKPIPNKWIKKCLRDLNLPYGLDGELVTVNNLERDDFNSIQSKVSSSIGTPNFYYKVFDFFGQESYEMRYERAKQLIPSGSFVSLINSHLCKSMHEVMHYYKLYVEMNNYEGICLRRPSSKYRQGRSTMFEGSLFALTPWETAEGTCVGFEEALEGLNDRGKDVLGSLVLRSDDFLLDFNVGSGFTELERMEIWENKNFFLGKKVTYKYKANRTKKDRPISPIFKGFRSLIEL